MNNKGVKTVRRARVPQAGRLAVAVVAVAMALTACGTKVTGAAAAPTSAPPAQAETTSAKATPSTPPGSGKTASAAVASWVTLVLKGDFEKACRSTSVVSAEPGDDVDKLCASGGEGFDAIKQLHEGWATKPGVKLPPEVKVTVNDVKGQDGKATVPDTDVKVGDKTLRDIELIESTGDTSSFQLSLQVQKKDDLWYVAGMNIKA